MFSVMFFSFGIKNAIGVIKDVCQGTVFYARNIHKYHPYSLCSFRDPLSPFAPDGLQVQTFKDVILYLKNPKIKNVVVLAGAGISTPCGIPDFRTPGTGLYANLQKYNLPYPEAIFDLSYFCHDQKPFFSLAKEIYPGNFRPSVAHYFVKMLDEKEKLLRMYTQNIDGLERVAGIPTRRLVEAHGSFETATCLACGARYEGKSIKEEIFADKVPRCKPATCGGIIKPDITFFGESMPEKFWKGAEDMKQADLIIIMGTSLLVQPFGSLADDVSDHVPRLLINKSNAFSTQRRNDIYQKGDVEDIIPELVQSLGWSDHLKKVMSSGAAE